MSVKCGSHSQLWRIYNIHSLLKNGGFVSSSTLCEAQQCKRKTIYRTIEWMRGDPLYAPICYDRFHKGYHYTEKGWSLPFLEMMPSEYSAIILALQISAQYGNTPIAQKLEAFFSKSLLGAGANVQAELADLEKLVSFHGQPEQRITPKAWQIVFDALMQHRLLYTDYQYWEYEADTLSCISTTLEPVHLANVKGDWHLIAYDRNAADNVLRHYSLSRMLHMKTGAHFESKLDFNPDIYFRDLVGKFVAPAGHKLFPVTLRLRNHAAVTASEHRWHPKQKLRRLTDGSVELSLPMPSLREACGFCLSWGADAEVIGPPELRKCLRKAAKELHALYGRG